MNTITTNDTAISVNNTVISFTDWQHKPVKLMTEYIDEHTARVDGKWEGITIGTAINDHCVGIGVTVIITDDERKGFGIVAGLNIAAEMFETNDKITPFEAVIKAVQKAVENALTYASLYSNKNGVSIEKLEAALRNYDQEFSSTMSRYLKDDTDVYVTDTARLVAAE